jgi:hypothetical protein
MKDLEMKIEQLKLDARNRAIVNKVNYDANVESAAVEFDKALQALEAQRVPLFKKGDFITNDNYQPLSLLLEDVYERGVNKYSAIITRPDGCVTQFANSHVSDNARLATNEEVADRLDMIEETGDYPALTIAAAFLDKVDAEKAVIAAPEKKPRYFRLNDDASGYGIKNFNKNFFASDTIGSYTALELAEKFPNDWTEVFPDFYAGDIVVCHMCRALIELLETVFDAETSDDSKCNYYSVNQNKYYSNDSFPIDSKDTLATPEQVAIYEAAKLG